jgi:hypothetical protein
MFQNECRHNQLGGCKNGGCDDVSLNEVSMNIVFEISYPLAFYKTLGQMILYDVSRPWGEGVMFCWDRSGRNCRGRRLVILSAVHL